jgi:hypothetical protein
MGGLGLLNTKKMNIALLTKWIWRLYQEEENIWLLERNIPRLTTFSKDQGKGALKCGKTYIKSSTTLLWELNFWLETGVARGSGLIGGSGTPLCKLHFLVCHL